MQCLDRLPIIMIILRPVALLSIYLICQVVVWAMFLCSVTHGNLNIRLRTLVNSSHIVTVNDLSVSLPLLDEKMSVLTLDTDVAKAKGPLSLPTTSVNVAAGASTSMQCHDLQQAGHPPSHCCVVCVPQPGQRERDLLYCTVHCTVLYTAPTVQMRKVH